MLAVASAYRVSVPQGTVCGAISSAPIPQVRQPSPTAVLALPSLRMPPTIQLAGTRREASATSFLAIAIAVSSLMPGLQVTLYGETSSASEPTALPQWRITLRAYWLTLPIMRSGALHLAWGIL